MSQPYKSTALFDEGSIPAALRRDHSTKAGIWGVIRVLEGGLRVEYSLGGVERLLQGGDRALVRPQEVHRVEPVGQVRMLVEFYDCEPAGF